jgi:hypothetical protein
MMSDIKLVDATGIAKTEPGGKVARYLVFQDKWTEARKGIFLGSHHNLIIFYLIRIIFFLALFQPFHLC